MQNIHSLKVELDAERISERTISLAVFNFDTVPPWKILPCPGRFSMGNRYWDSQHFKFRLGLTQAKSPYRFGCPGHHWPRIEHDWEKPSNLSSRRTRSIMIHGCTSVNVSMSHPCSARGDKFIGEHSCRLIECSNIHTAQIEDHHRCVCFRNSFYNLR